MNKRCILTISTKSNVLRTRVFHIYRNGINCKSKVSFFLKSSVRRLKAKKKIEFKRKRKIFSVLVRSRQWILRLDGSQRRFSDNSILILKKNSNSWSNYLRGPTLLELKRKKYLTIFKNIY